MSLQHTTTVPRAALALTALIFAAWMLVELALSLHDRGTTPPYQKRQLSDGTYVVQNITPDIAKATKLRVADVIDFPHEDLPDRVRWWQGAPVGTTIPELVRRGTGSLVVHIPVWPEQIAYKVGDTIDLASKVVLMALAIGIFWRGRDANSLIAGSFLYLFAMGSGPNVRFVDLPWWSVLILQTARLTAFALSTLLVMWLATNLVGRALPRVARDALLVVATVFSAIVLAGGLDLNLSIPFSGFEDVHRAQVKLAFVDAQVAAMVLPIAVLLFGTFQRGNAVDLVKVRWMFAATALGLTGPVVNVLTGLFTKNVYLHGMMTASLIVMAGIYVYAIVRHRLVDVSFVMNRAAVFAAALAVVTFLAVVVEVALDRAITTKNEESAIFTYGVAVLLGVTFRFFEERAKPVIDSTLFARRHRAEQALQALASDLNQIGDTTELAETVAEQVRQLTSSRRVVIYAKHDRVFAPIAVDGSDTAELLPVGAGDQVIARLSGGKSACEAAGLHTKVPADAIAFPIHSGGKLLGAMVCQSRLNEYPFDPDECAVLLRVAHEFGDRLLVLRAA
ncbi:MAG: GAF domain-containing protein [Candidatus Eremiobacteraeota bacterium]|nr:GAF domain-containing protein [Candidatus Eremiobacteraeota bacterium]